MLIIASLTHFVSFPHNHSSTCISLSFFRILIINCSPSLLAFLFFLSVCPISSRHAPSAVQTCSVTQWHLHHFALLFSSLPFYLSWYSELTPMVTPEFTLHSSWNVHESSTVDTNLNFFERSFGAIEGHCNLSHQYIFKALSSSNNNNLLIY